jgi:uncharacterized membrane protein YdjX (TVP38/TMEM64 family)
MSSQRRNYLALIGFPLFFITLIILFWVFRSELMGFFDDREGLRAWVLGWGSAGFLAFILVQAFQVVLFMVPGEVVQVAGGWIFGLWQGSLISIAGIGLGSLVNFSAGRLLGRPFVVSLFGEAKVGEMEGVAQSGKAAAGFFLLFVIPGIPKDILCYIAGITRLRFGTFLAISLVGRLPGIIGSSWMGAAAQEGDWTLALIILGFATLLFVIGLMNREKIIARLSGLLSKGEKKPAGSSDPAGRS